MFGFIKKLIAGIFGFITGLLPGKKQGGYYLQLEETGTGTAPVVATAPAAESTNGKKAEATPEPAKATKTAKKEAAQNGKSAPAEPAPAPVAKTKPAAPAETLFAPKYLIPSANGSNGRRRPGANMNSYLDLATQVKTPV